jgi:hypothetical protein
VITGRVIAAAMPLLGRALFEVVLIVRPQESHSEQDDDHNQGNHGCQNDQHRLVHRTIHRGLGLRVALTALVPAIGTITPEPRAPWTVSRINR